MEERYNQKSGDIFLWISREEFNKVNTEGPGALIGKLVSKEKCVAFLVTRSLSNNTRGIHVKPTNNNDDKVQTNFSIEIGNDAWQDLMQHRFVGDRYLFTQGGEKITILLGSPDVEGLDALPR